MQSFLVILILGFLAIACSNNSGRVSANIIPSVGKRGEVSNLRAQKTTNGSEICLFSNDTVCVDFTGIQWSSEQIHNICVYYQGSVTQSSCADGDIVAECILNKGLASEALIKYYLPITRENASVDCDQANGILH